MTGIQVYNFVMQNFDNIFDDVNTQIQLALFYLSTDFKNKEQEEIELSDETEALFQIYLQTNVFKELEKYTEV